MQTRIGSRPASQMASRAAQRHLFVGKLTIELWASRTHDLAAVTHRALWAGAAIRDFGQVSQGNARQGSSCPVSVLVRTWFFESCNASDPWSGRHAWPSV